MSEPKTEAQIKADLKELNRKIRDKWDTVQAVKDALKNAREDYEAAVNELTEYIDELDQPKLPFAPPGEHPSDRPSESEGLST